MAGLYSRLKTWVSKEALTAADLNAEFDNVIDNFDPDKMNDLSADVTAYRETADPGESGTESLPVNLEQELHRLRKILVETTGKDYWYESPSTNIQELNTTFVTSANHVTSGATRSATSNQPMYLVADGTTNEATVKGTGTNLKLKINNSVVTVSADVTVTGLGLAPSTNNTCDVDDTALAGGDETKLIGEEGSTITVDAMGSEITSLVGEWASFKTGSGYFHAYVESSTELTHCRRGYFFDDTEAPVERVAISDNDTITLLRTSWLFMGNDGTTVTATTTAPRVGGDEPSAPNTDDFWYDFEDDEWKKYSGSTFESANATYIGLTVQDTANCIAARSEDFFAFFSDFNETVLVKESNSELRTSKADAAVSVMGKDFVFSGDFARWVMPTDLETGSEASSTQYFCYLTDEGKSVLSTIVPYDRRGDLKGHYHPYNPWRAVGSVLNDGSSDFEDPTSYSNADMIDDGVPVTRVLSTPTSGTITGSDTTVGTITVYSDGRPLRIYGYHTGTTGDGASLNTTTGGNTVVALNTSATTTSPLQSIIYSSTLVIPARAIEFVVENPGRGKITYYIVSNTTSTASWGTFGLAAEHVGR